jgi:hypothetical protein
METRNPTEAESLEYDRVSAAIEDARLALEEWEIDLRERYALPADVTVSGDGTFLLGNQQRLRQKQKPGAPTRLQAALGNDEMAKLIGLRAAVDRAKHNQARFSQKLRGDCAAPHFARLDTNFRWVSPDNPPRPIVAAELSPDDELPEDNANVHVLPPRATEPSHVEEEAARD